MITIDQLLESVDLDFEPRWVTKDQNGTVWLWEKKPQAVENWWDNTLSLKEIGGKIKISEFENKDCQECIYEVPRKTTGKIERLEMQEISRGGENLVLYTEAKPATPYDMHLKINEIIDWINDNHKDSK